MLRHPGLLVVAFSLSPALIGCALDTRTDPGSGSEAAAQTSQAIGGPVSVACQPNYQTVLQIDSLTADMSGNVQISLCVPSEGSYFDILEREVGGGIDAQYENRSGTLNLTGQGVGAYLAFQAQPCFAGWGNLNTSVCGQWTPTAFVYAPTPGTFWVDMDQHGGPDPWSFQTGTESLPGGGTRALYSCAVMFNGTTQVGKAFQDAPGLCFFGYGGGEQIVAHGMTLEAPNQYNDAHGLYWSQWVASARYMGPNPVAAGSEPNNTEYICQAPFVNPITHLTDTVPGKTVGGTCNISWGGREYAIDPSSNDVRILNTW